MSPRYLGVGIGYMLIDSYWAMTKCIADVVFSVLSELLVIVAFLIKVSSDVELVEVKETFCSSPIFQHLVL